ncbi:MAG: histidinol dehydrogenase [Candidatus Eremiobacteraeota bacterium]|nr:histidinol dehydrogenase [Candidatus Eremiobacteraeota bacterium]
MTRQILRRVSAEAVTQTQPIRSLPNVDVIINEVRRDGDEALARFAAQFGDPRPRRIQSDELIAAYERIDPALRDALNCACARIRAFACVQREAFLDVSVAADNALIGHRIMPIRRVGAYIPGGRYPLPSSLLMSVVPARVAGVAHIVVCSPSEDPAMLAAAHIAGIAEFYLVGGAQAIAALAYGTPTISPVDLIVGPGNAYVASAKRAVFGQCGIDALAGPSEILIIASNDADPEYVAADILAQCEHDVLARAVLLSDDAAFVDAVNVELERQLLTLSTAPIAQEALAQSICAVMPLAQAIDAANAVAPEHLHLQGARAELLSNRAVAYGSLFIGAISAEAFGDYGLGPNHVLPTSGTARFASGLSVLSFLTVRTFQQFTAAPSEPLIVQTALLAQAEGLSAHRNAALLRGSYIGTSSPSLAS